MNRATPSSSLRLYLSLSAPKSSKFSIRLDPDFWDLHQAVYLVAPNSRPRQIVASFGAPLWCLRLFCPKWAGSKPPPSPGGGVSFTLLLHLPPVSLLVHLLCTVELGLRWAGHHPFLEILKNSGPCSPSGSPLPSLVCFCSTFPVYITFPAISRTLLSPQQGRPA